MFDYTTVKNCRLFMLRTEDKSCLYKVIDLDGSVLTCGAAYGMPFHVGKQAIYQHLYITDNQEIKVGDWGISLDHVDKYMHKKNALTRADNKVEADSMNRLGMLKIVAST